tara:strand:+ start:94476 stop:96122 length:1647 start_codon:yes stop_codon:yes gene_type:complete
MKFLTTLLICCFQLTLFAQFNVGDVSMNFGSEITAEDGEIVHIAGESDNVTYALAKKKKNYFIQTFRVDNQDFITDKEIELEKIGKNKVTLEDFAVVNGSVYVFASYYDKSNKQQKFVAYPVASNLSLGAPKTVLTAKVEKKNQPGGFIFKPSYNEEHYMVTYINFYTKDEKMTYEFTLLDGDLKSVKDDKVTLQFEDRKDLHFSLDDITVNRNGDIFIVVSDSYRDKKKKTTFTNLELHAYYAANNHQREVLSVDFKGKKVVNCDAMYTNDGKLQLIGFYSDLRKSGRSDWRIEGIFNVTVNTNNNTVSKEVFNKFTFETKKKLIGERRAKKGKDLSPNYRNTHFIERDNGGVIVLSEYYLTLVGRSSGIGPLAFTPITYITNEIIVTALDAEGNLDWSNVVPKEQQVTVTQFSIGLIAFGGNGNFAVGAGAFFPIAILGEGPEYLSSIPMYDNGKLSLLVNDDPKNIGITDIDDVKKVRNVKKMIPVLFSFDDANGKMTRQDPEEFEKKQLVVRPYVNYRVGQKQYIIYASNKEGKRLGLLSIDTN